MNFIINTKNSKHDWFLGYKKWCQFDYSSCEKCVINVALPEHADTKKHTEVTDLRYFFPLLDKIHEDCENAVVQLNIYIIKGDLYDELGKKSGTNWESVISKSDNADSKKMIPQDNDDSIEMPQQDNTEFERMRFRVKVFFQYFVSTQKHNTEIFINNSLLKPSKLKRSRISPIFEVREGSISTLSIADLAQSYFDVKSKRIESSSANRIVHEACSFLNSLLESLMDSNNFIGTKDFPISESRKSELCKELQVLFDNNLPQINYIAQMIWLYFLQNILENKELLTFNAINGIANLRVDLIEKSLFDSIAYAEGILQLLENSCLYSEGKCAWFGFRIHRASRNRPMSEFQTESRTRQFLYEKYADCYRKNGSIIPQNIFNEDYRYFIEFFVLDRAFQGIGILRHYNNSVTIYNQENSSKTPKKKLTDDDDIFNLLPRNPLELDSKDDAISCFVEDVTIHYGLKWFYRIALRNNGCFILNSPSMRSYYRSMKGGNPPFTHNASSSNTPVNDVPPVEIKTKVEYCTEYTILLPVSYKWEETRDEFNSNLGQQPSYSDLSDYRSILKFVNLSKAVDFVEKQKFITKLKGELFTSIFQREWSLTTKDIDRINGQIIVIEVPRGNKFDTECIAKALFGVLSYIHFSVRKFHLKECHPRIAIKLSDNSLLYEFVRIFAVFFDKVGLQNVLSNSQIALCITADKDYPAFVGLVLSGSNIYAAQETIRQYLYFNSTATANMLSIADYLTDVAISEKEAQIRHDLLSQELIDTNHEKTSIFPFELFLRNKTDVELCEKKDLVPTSPTFESWFLYQTKYRLLKDYQLSSYGCKISNTNIRVGSKVYLDTFYVAELLFHNPVITHHFAYLLADDLKKRIDSEKLSCTKIVLLGYEYYSAILVQQIKNILSSIGEGYEDCIYTAITLNTNYDESRIIYSSVNPFKKNTGSLKADSLNGKKETALEDHTDKFTLVTIVPIGTTLSTVQKMHSIFEKELKNATIQHYKNYCLILSANYDKFKNAINKYWSYHLEDLGIPDILPVDSSGNTVYIFPDKSLNSDSHGAANPVEIGKITVTYLVNVDSKWEIPFMAALELEAPESDCSQALPLIEVDKASSNPICIFPQRDKETDCFEYDEKNSDILASFYSKFYYSHIERGENHFQFYFDFKKFLSERNNIVNIENWLKKIAEKVNSNAYNIIITPVNETISLFLKLVTDIVFHNKARLLIIPADNSYRESIRVKYSYIAEECAVLRRNDPNYRINVYYVNDSIINGHSIERGLYLINMLLPSVLEKMVYTKIILLVNRSSYDTISRYVYNASDDLLAYVHLAIPSYNMRNGTCPACDLQKKYERLRERSSTIVLANEFNRLAQKHELKNEDEYVRWMKNRIKNSKTDFSRMLFWIYVFEESDYAKDISNAISVSSLKVSVLDLKEVKNKVLRVKQILQTCDRSAISEGLPSEINLLGIDDDAKKELINFIMNFVNASKDYLRLETMHNAYRELIPLPEGYNASKELDGYNANKELYDITVDRMLELIAEPLKKQTTQWQLIKNAESIISYIKVLSRDYIARYYHCRVAIYRIMLIITNYMLGDDAYVIQERSKISSPSSNTNLTMILDTIRKPTASFDETEENLELCIGMQYEVFMTLMHRLADMQSEFVFEASTIQKTLKFYNTLLQTKEKNKHVRKSDEYESFIYCYLPRFETAAVRYLKAIKTAVMATDNDRLSSVLYDSWESLKGSFEGKEFPSDYLVDAEGSDSGIISGLPDYNYLYLENSQYLYKGLSDLSERSKDNKECKELLLDAYRIPNEKASERLSVANLSYQNPFFFFCRMWHKTHNDQSPIAEKKPGISEWNKLSNLLDYYRTTKSLLNTDIPIDDVPYEFEKICNSIGRFSNFDMCYIVTHLEGYLPQIVSQSGYLVDYLKEQAILEREDIEHFLSFVNSSDPEKMATIGLKRIIDGIYDISQYKFPAGTRTKQSKYECHFLRVIKIGYAGEPDKEIQYYVILQNAIAKGKSLDQQHGLETLECAQGILCMREKLSLVIKKYSDALLSLRYDCSYIKFFEKGKTKGKPNILHISDLHIADSQDLDQDIMLENITTKIKTELEKGNVDLLVITGDIVDCRVADAPIIQNNYRQAEKVILHIVSCLWAQEASNPRLPHDWKRRIIASPGNHDFAAMNQYRASLSKRALSAGVPSAGESGTMAKFTYFIEFMLHFLDAPVDEMLKNDLNDIRHYRNLNLSVINLNALSVSSPIRTNKIGVNENKLDELISRKNWEKAEYKYRVCTAHYSPNYKPNYLLDAYDISLVQFSDDDTAEHKGMYEQLKDRYQEFSGAFFDMLLTLTPEQYKTNYIASPFYKIYFATDYFNDVWQTCIPSNKGDDDKEVKSSDKLKKFKHSEFFKEIHLFNKMLLEVPTDIDASANEQINRMIDFYRRALVIQNSDHNIYKYIFEKKIKSVDAILAGHVHEEHEDVFEESGSKVFVSGRTICGKSYTNDGSINCKLIELPDKLDKDPSEDL